jgi:arsenate reductase
MPRITIYHNPQCGTSRNTLAMIRNSGAEPEVIEYLKTPPDRATLLALIAATGQPVINAVRTKEALFTELHLGAPGVTDTQRRHAAGHAAVSPVRAGAGHPARTAEGSLRQGGR